MDYFLFYLILRLDTLSSTSIILAIVAGVVFAVTLFICATNYNSDTDKKTRKAAKPWAISFGIVFAFTLLFAVGLPSTKQAAVIYCLPKIVNNEQVQKMPNNLLKLANQWIDEHIDKPSTETVNRKRP